MILVKPLPTRDRKLLGFVLVESTLEKSWKDRCREEECYKDVSEYLARIFQQRGTLPPNIPNVNK